MAIRYLRPTPIYEARFHRLRSREYIEKFVEYMLHYNEHPGPEHARWKDLDPKWRDAKPFAIIRNPWARVASRYFFSQYVADTKRPDGSPWAIYPKCTFEEFLEQRKEYGRIKFFWHRAVRGWYPAFDYVTDAKGVIRCDILRCEHLGEDLDRLFGTPMNVEHRNITPGKTMPYQDLYTDETKEIVAEWYEKDIRVWGFKFDGSATKNTIAQQ